MTGEKRTGTALCIDSTIHSSPTTHAFTYGTRVQGSVPTVLCCDELCQSGLL